MDHLISIKLFEHCRLIVAMVLSLALARLLNGLARFIQHPKKVKVYSIHMCWSIAILLFLVHFWWWEFKLIAIEHWTFESYLLIILYAIVFFLICTLLFPDHMDEYSGFEDYFTSRRKWFFGMLALTFVIDIGDTLLKGVDHFQSLGVEYPVRNLLYVVLCIIAMFVGSRKYQLTFVMLSLIYELSYIFRLFHTIQ